MRKSIRVSKNFLNWDRSEELEWLLKDEIPADPLEDMNTKNNKLSIFVLENFEEELGRFIAAFTSIRSEVKDFDFLFFDLEILDGLGIDYEPNNAKTKDEIVNTWHSDVINLSAQKLVLLTKELYSRSTPDRILKKDVIWQLCNSINNGWIDASKLPEKIKSQIKCN